MLLVLGPSEPVAAAPTYSVVPRLSVEETYDDNVFRAAENRQDDFITRIGAGLGASLSDARLGAQLGYGLSAEFFAQGTEENGQLSHDASASISYRATRQLTLRAGNGFRLADTTETAAEAAIPGVFDPSVPPPPEATPPGTVPTRRVRQLTNTATAGASYRYDAVTTLGASYAYETLRYDSPDLVDTDTHRIGVTGSRQVTRRDSVGLAYSFSLTDAEGADRDDDERVHEAGLTWHRTFSEDLSASAGVGVTWTEGRDVEVGPAGTASLVKSIGRTRYSASYSSEFRIDNTTGELSRSDTVRLGAVRDLTSNTSVQAAVAGSRSDPLEGEAGATYTFSGTAGLSTLITRWLSANVGYVFERSDAPPGSDSFRNNRVTLGLTVLFPPVARGLL